ncbi:IS110 family transposase, partial [Nocardia gipuzkoensis]
ADLGSIRIEATLAEYRRLAAWARRWPQRRWAVENRTRTVNQLHTLLRELLAAGSRKDQVVLAAAV